MSRMILMSKFLLMMILLTLFILCGCGIKNGNLEESTQIFEIKNTKVIYNYPDSKIATIEKHYMIINLPEDLYELKTVIEKFYKDNPIDKEFVVEKNKIRQFEIYFYRESKKLPRDWQPNEAYLDTDRIEQHKDDCIAAIFWSDSELHKNYDIMRKSSNRDDYGAVIEEISYIDNEIVN